MAEYDVFISFKNTDENDNPTVDSKMAEDLYHALKKKGINAFYSNISIDEGGDSDWGQSIENALEECFVLVAVGTKAEHLKSNYVYDEISSFKKLILDDKKTREKSAIVSYISKDFSPRDLPLSLSKYQAYTDIEKLVLFIENRLKNNGIEFDINITPFEIGDTILNRYTLLKIIGQGGVSMVYLALDNNLNRTVAIKCARKSDYTNFDIIKDMFLSEIEIIKKLNHNSIVRIYDVDFSSDQLLIVMDYIEGTSLNEILKDYERIPQEEVISIAKQLCDVLAYLHSRKPAIIYRDIKPANIIFQSKTKIMLFDFGTAREYKQGNLADTVCLGTRGYAAPEQYGGMGQTDARTDIYALGVTLYHLVTGKNPCEPPYEVRPIREINPDLSAGLEYIILKCTRNDPDDRFQTAEEVLQALNNIDSLTQKLNRKNFFHNIGKKKSKVNKTDSQTPTRVSNPPVSPSACNPPTETLPTEDELIKPTTNPVKPCAETALLDKSIRNSSANEFMKTSNQKMLVDSVAQVSLCVCSYKIDGKEITSAFLFSKDTKQQLLVRLKKLSAKLLIKPSKPFVVRPYDVLTLTTNGSLYCEFCWTGSVCETTICEPFRTIEIYHYGKKLAKISLDS